MGCEWVSVWVIDIDPQYQVAAVSDPKREYLWVLSRNPQLVRLLLVDVQLLQVLV